MRRHEDAGAALLSRTLAPQAVDLAVVVHAVVLEHGQLDLAVLVLDLLGRRVVLLLALLSAAAQAQHEVKCRLLLDVVVRQRPSVLELLAREDETLLIRRDALLVLDLSLHILDGVGRLDLERDRFARQSLDENLHLAFVGSDAERKRKFRGDTDVTIQRKKIAQPRTLRGNAEFNSQLIDRLALDVQRASTRRDRTRFG